jgi:hypothetical protein
VVGILARTPGHEGGEVADRKANGHTGRVKNEDDEEIPAVQFEVSDGIVKSGESGSSHPMQQVRKLKAPAALVMPSIILSRPSASLASVRAKKEK